MSKLHEMKKGKPPIPENPSRDFKGTVANPINGKLPIHPRWQKGGKKNDVKEWYR